MKMVVGLSIWEMGRGVRGDLIAVSCYFMDTQREEAKLGAHWKCGRQWTQLGTREFLLGLKEKIFPVGGVKHWERGQRGGGISIFRGIQKHKALSDVIQLCSDPWLNERPLGSIPTKTFL